MFTPPNFNNTGLSYCSMSWTNTFVTMQKLTSESVCMCIYQAPPNTRAQSQERMFWIHLAKVRECHQLKVLYKSRKSREVTKSADCMGFPGLFALQWKRGLNISVQKKSVALVTCKFLCRSEQML